MNPLSVYCKFYEYRDENGVRRFTDNPDSVPDQSKNKVVEHRDRYDYMTEEEKAEALQKREDEISERRLKIKEDVRRYLKTVERREAAERERKRLESLRTKVTIRNNQVLVPVTLTYQGKSVTTTLLLDTGATNTVIYDDVAEKLGITTGKTGYAVLAGGKVVKTKQIEVDGVKVGPKSMEKVSITVLKNIGFRQAHSGLLGFDFLGRYGHTIDRKGQLIIWTE